MIANNALRFTVVVWVKKTNCFPELRDELVGLSASEPDETTELEGVVDFHWGFPSLREAEQVAEALTVLCSRPEMILLKVADVDNPKQSTTFKDERQIRR